MKVWVVFETSGCDGYTVEGLFSTREKAEQYVQSVKDRFKSFGDNFPVNLEINEMEVV